MMQLNVQADVSAVQEALKKTSASMPSITKKCLRAAAKGYIKEYKKQVKLAGLKRVTGGLLSAYQFKLRSDSVTIYPGRDQIRKVITQNEGKTIKPRGKKVLKIKNADGSSAFAKSVTIKGRNFVEPSARYFDSPQMGIDMQDIVDKEIQKMWG